MLAKTLSKKVLQCRGRNQSICTVKSRKHHTAHHETRFRSSVTAQIPASAELLLHALHWVALRFIDGKTVWLVSLSALHNILLSKQNVIASIDGRKANEDISNQQPSNSLHGDLLP